MVTTPASPQTPAVETLAIPLAGLTDATVNLSFGGGELSLHRAEPGMLVSGTFDGGAVWRTPRPGTVEVEPDMSGGRFVLCGPRHWNVGITAEIPVTLRLQMGANRSTLDLSDLRIPELELHTGASETAVRMPAAGRTAVRVECGLASISVEVPTGVAARIRGRLALGATDVDESRFPRSGRDWQSPDYDTAADAIDLAIDGALGSIRIS